jgi:alginate O-acetyltransferase complex protein AlgJ
MESGMKVGRSGLWLVAVVLAGACCIGVRGAEGVDRAKAFVAEMKVLAEAGDDAGPVVVGSDGWLFLRSELRHVGAGRFWGEGAAEVSGASRAEWADPVPAIVDFNEQCRGAGVELIFVPVPPKAVIYPEKISGVLDRPPDERLDVVHAELYGLLRERGVKVIDLTPIFLEARAEASAPLYCRTDSHWSGEGMKLAAERIAEQVRQQAWHAEHRRGPMPIERVERTIEIDGDLRQMLGDDERIERESLRLTWVEHEGSPIAADRGSPIMLLGDSHVLVFHIGRELHAKGAGLADQLAAELRAPLDVVGVRGSGATPCRINLMRRKDNLAGKRTIIWCMSAREFTETTGWRKVPVVR